MDYSNLFFIFVPFHPLKTIDNRQWTIPANHFVPFHPSPQRQLKIDNGIFRLIRGLICDHMTKLDQSARSNCNNSQKDLKMSSSEKSKRYSKTHKIISDSN